MDQEQIDRASIPELERRRTELYKWMVFGLEDWLESHFYLGISDDAIEAKRLEYERMREEIVLVNRALDAKESGGG